MTQVTADESRTIDFGLRRDILSPMETLAQSVSTIAPTTTPQRRFRWYAPSQGTALGWLIYWPQRLCCSGSLHCALCASFLFARFAVYLCCDDVTPGWAQPWLGVCCWLMWQLEPVFIGGFYHYANLLLRDATGHSYSNSCFAVLVATISIGIAYRDVKVRARMML